MELTFTGLEFLTEMQQEQFKKKLINGIYLALKAGDVSLMEQELVISVAFVPRNYA